MTDRLRGPGPVLGLWSVTADPKLLEVSASLKPDFLVIDTQHGTPMARLTTETFGAIAFYDVPALVRVPGIDPTDIGRALNLEHRHRRPPRQRRHGRETRTLACRYTPGWNPLLRMQTIRLDPFSDDYRPLCVVQIETAAAVAKVEMAAVDGVDWLYVGPADLGLSIGGVPAPDVISVFDGTRLAQPLQTAFDTGARRGPTSRASRPACTATAVRLRLRSLPMGSKSPLSPPTSVPARRGMANELKIARG